MTLDEKKKKKRKKKHCDSITYTTGDPMLNDYFFNKINGSLGNDTEFGDTDVSDSADISGEGTGESGGFGESLTEAMSYTTIKNILNQLWDNRNGSAPEGVLATIDQSGGSTEAIIKWAETRSVNVIQLSGLDDFDINKEITTDEDKDPDKLGTLIKQPKTVVLITNYYQAPTTTKTKYLLLFTKKNIGLIIVTGLEKELNKIPANYKEKFSHQVSFLNKDQKDMNNLTNDTEPTTEALITEAKREVRRYYIRPQNIFCANKAEIIKALIDIGDQNCSVYTLKYLGPEKDINKLTAKDIIYYYDNEILYDKNHVKVMDYDLYIKHEEERKKFSDVEDVPEEKFNDEYEDRIHQNTVLEDIDNPFDEDFADINAFGEAMEQKFVCCICGEPSEGHGNNPHPYKKKGKCCDACNLKFVIPARYDEWQVEYNWPTLEEPDEVE
jgi:hypothetical protein